MFQYPGAMMSTPGTAQAIAGQMQGQPFTPMGQPMPQSPVFGPAQSPTPSQGMGQGNYPTGYRIGMRVVPVASYDEAKAVATDFAGNMTVMTDLSHDQIYTKVLDPITNSVSFQVYRRVPDQPVPTPEQIHPQTAQEQVTPEPQYDVRAEMEKIREELELLKRELGITEKEEQK